MLNFFINLAYIKYRSWNKNKEKYINYRENLSLGASECY